MDKEYTTHICKENQDFIKVLEIIKYIREDYIFGDFGNYHIGHCLDKISERKQLSINNSCSDFVILLGSILYENNIKSIIVLVSKEGKNNYHLFTEIDIDGNKLYVSIGNAKITITDKRINGKEIFRKKYEGERNIREVFNGFRLGKIILEVKTIIGKILPKQWIFINSVRKKRDRKTQKLNRVFHGRQGLALDI